jgi:glutamate-1-semialdehyde 2,1-aminomutase
MLLSKRAEQFLPEGWPAYFSRASGCSVWDLDGVEYIDVGLMGVGTNILGYGHPKVDEAVRNVVAQGNLSTLNCPEEVELAERLVELHPWADMAKFTRSGGEAGAVAIRIARAASGKSAVAICGYHGWHDWYLSANLADDAALDGHLLPGLEPNGVPRNLQGLTRPFVYNDLPALERILAEGDVGVVIMEVERSTPPDPGFLESVRSLTTKHDAVLIFDECTSGFRKVMGGLHLHYGVEPDMAIFGKTLGNGYAINAVIGRESVMRSAEATFISSTFWTERIGPAAALAALNAMADEDAPRQIDEIGLRVRDGWRQVCEGLGLGVSFSGLPALSVMSVEGVDAATFRPFLTEQMLASGYLAGPAVYASVAHSDEVLHHYFDALEIVLDSTLSIGNTEGSGSSSNCACPPSGFGRLA